MQILVLQRQWMTHKSHQNHSSSPSVTFLLRSNDLIWHVPRHSVLTSQSFQFVIKKNCDTCERNKVGKARPI